MLSVGLGQGVEQAIERRSEVPGFGEVFEGGGVERTQQPGSRRPPDEGGERCMAAAVLHVLKS